MKTLQSTIFIEFDVNTKKITFLRRDNIIDYDSYATSVYVRVKYKDLSGNTAYLTPSELEEYKFYLYTIKPSTNNFNEITGEVTDEFKENTYGGVVKFEIPRVCTNRLGIVKCEIHINQGNKTIGSSTFVLDVKQSLVTAFDDELLGDEDFPVLKQLILEIQKASNINDSAASLVTTYSGNKIENIKEELDSQIKDIDKMIKSDISTINTKLIAHRGNEAIAPENTIIAFESAKEYGYDGVEFDVQQTSDGEFIIMHDETVDRTTNGTGRVSDLTFTQIQALTIDSGVNIDKYSNLSVPTLEEALICCKKCGLIPIIEIKPFNSKINVEKFLKILSDQTILYNCIIISFDTLLLEEIRNKNKFVNIQALMEINTNNIDYCYNNNFSIDCENSKITKELVNYAHSKNVQVNCYTVSFYNIYNNLLSLGVDFITANNGVVNRNSYNIQIMEINDELTEIHDRIEEVKLGTLSGIGALYKYAFNEGTSTIRAFCRNKFMISKLAQKIKIEIPSGFRYAINGFNYLNQKVYDSDWKTNDTINIPNGIKYFILYFSKSDNSDLTEDDLTNLKNNTKVNVGKIDKAIRMYRIYYSAGNPILKTDFSYDTCQIDFTDTVTTITHDKPFFARKGVVNINLASTAPNGYRVATDYANETGFEIKIFKDGVLCSKTDLSTVSGIWIDVIHVGYDFIDC